MVKKFPENFLWGAATSAPQSEGAQYEEGKTPSTWDVWYEKEPERFYNGVGPKDTSLTYERYGEDAKLMAEMNLNSFRTSISWNRLLPDGKTVNEKAVRYYRDYFSKLKEQGVEPIVNLFHFDMPWWLMEKGGWESRESIEHFAYYADTAFEQFGDIVQDWMTFNEPIVHVQCGYLGNDHWPQVNNFKRAIQVAYHTMLAHAAAVKVFKEKQRNGRIGIILNLSPVYARSDKEEDQEARGNSELLHIKSFLDPAVLGKYPEELVTMLRDNDLLPAAESGDSELLTAGKVDYLGVNYYQPLRVQAVNKEKVHHPAKSPSDFSRAYDWPEKRMNLYRGWEIYPEGIYDIAIMLKDEYENIPWYISENGMGVSDEERFMDEEGIVQDDYRIEFIRDHLDQTLKAIGEGANCFGYHLWTFVDCWSWLNAYKNRYGYYRYDLETGKRIPKKSSFWMSEIIQRNELDR
ncbi:glycoside hydrolase family 1 protein [Desemzia sp. FAM 23991]|uniref:glycoside hydrolase family 1 protein n=1 Tax=unclassified Desemzia TaxID=2685243 RepID=UPI0038894DB9